MSRSRAIQALAFVPGGDGRLHESLEALVEKFSVDSGIDARLMVVGSRRPLGAKVERALYRVAHEALAGAWRHPGCRTAEVRLVFDKPGATLRIAGNVICRQRPGTAKGFMFISLEDETGVSNAIVTPDLFERTRLLITEEPFLAIEGEVQNTDNVVLIKAQKIFPLAHEGLLGSESHDFH